MTSYDAIDSLRQVLKEIIDHHDFGNLRGCDGSCKCCYCIGRHVLAITSGFDKELRTERIQPEDELMQENQRLRAIAWHSARIKELLRSIEYMLRFNHAIKLGEGDGG